MTVSMTSRGFSKSQWAWGFSSGQTSDLANSLAPTRTPPLMLISRKSSDVWVATVLLAAHFLSWTPVGLGLSISRNWRPLISDHPLAIWIRFRRQRVHAMCPVQQELSERKVKVGVHYPGFGWLHGPQVQNSMEAKRCRQRSTKVSLRTARIRVHD